MARSNLAYDFARFEQAAAKPKQETTQETKIQRVEKTSTKPKFHPVLFMAGLVTVVAIVSSMIHSGMRLNEVTDQINQNTKVLEELKSESVKQTLQIESYFSAQNIEEYATQVLGMQKLDKSQIRFLEFGEENKIEVADKGQETIFEKIKDIFNRFMEYIGIS